MEDYLNKVIVIKLKNKKIIQGNLQNFDQHLNLILTNSKDITDDDIKSLDNIILRGDNIMIVSLHNKFNSLNPKDDDSI